MVLYVLALASLLLHGARGQAGAPAAPSLESLQAQLEAARATLLPPTCTGPTAFLQFQRAAGTASGGHWVCIEPVSSSTAGDWCAADGAGGVACDQKPPALARPPRCQPPGGVKLFYSGAAGWLCSCAAGFRGVSCNISDGAASGGISSCQPTPCSPPQGTETYAYDANTGVMACRCAPGYAGAPCVYVGAPPPLPPAPPGGYSPPPPAPPPSPPSPPPAACTAYATLTDVWRGIVLPGLSPEWGFGQGHCDGSYTNTAPYVLAAGSWYRFDAGAYGDAVYLPEFEPPGRSCYADVVPYLVGGHPSVADGVVSRELCFSGARCGSTVPAGWDTSVQVLNCGAYYVYKLPLLQCPGGLGNAYCATSVPPGTKAPLSPPNPPPLPPFPPLPPLPPLPAQCSSYTALSDVWRGITLPGPSAAWAAVQGPWGNCDQSAVPRGWYRFDAGAYGEAAYLPEFAPPSRSCVADAIPYLVGGHPSAADGVVSRQLCFSLQFTQWCGTDVPAGWDTSVQVLNCGTYYVYNLPPLICGPNNGYAYCATSVRPGAAA
jgi:hypothetical protein